MTENKVSRQREWQKKQRNLGNCIVCGKGSGGALRCKPCAIKANRRNLKRYHDRKGEK